MRKTIIIALAAISFASIATSSQAGNVRDHRNSAPPVASKGQGGVTVTNSPVKCVVIRNDKVSLRGSCPR
jgi:uncharacterized protein YdeI (BOF family)